MTGFRFTAEPIHLIFCFSFVSLTTYVPQLLLHKTCLQEYNHNTTLCDNLSANKDLQANVQDKASFWQMLYLVTTNGIAFFTVLIWGPLTDVIGRKKGFIYASIVLIIVYVVTFLNTYFIYLPPAYMLIAAVLTGSYGDSSGMISLSYAYVADVTEESNRTKRMALLESFFYSGFLLGGLSCGYLIKYVGFIFVPIVNGGIVFLALLYACFIISGKPTNQNTTNQLIDNDSNINKASRNFDWKLINPFHHMKHVLLVFSHRETRVFIIVMYFVYFGIMLTVNGDLFLTPFYLDYAPFNASPDIIGYYIFVTGFLAALGAFITFIVSTKIHVGDALILVIGLMLLMIGFLVTGFARNLYMVFAGRIFQLALPLCTSISRALTTKIAGRYSDYGSILAGMECLDTLAATLASFLLGFIYNQTFQIYSGITFFVLAGTLLLLTICFIVMWTCKRPKLQVEELLVNEEEDQLGE